MSESTASTSLPVYEKLGVFYLGRPYDLETRTAASAPFLYDARDLVTHGFCVGMTGSGKTGLSIALLEEAVLDGIPALVIDPKGDLTNLALTFPDLAPADFAPWVDPQEAQQAGLSVDELAARKADTWRRGLAAWDQDGARIRRLREAAEVAIYTPGSSAGRPVSLLASFAPPPAAAAPDPDLLRDRVATTVSSVLALLRIAADPVKSREHILLSLLFERAWSAGRALALPELIEQVQRPAIERVGVMPLETFFPAGDRFALAMALNNLLASPGFASWMEGEPLDPARLLWTETGKPRLAIFSIAHLSDAERMFFVSLLLDQVVGWTRGLPGASGLRALVYMDEVFGYLPPVAEPPSKRPLLTLLKQGRAFGVGVLLASQNPVDLDYKALANIGTWFLGRLQTRRDKERLLDGLEGAAAGAIADRATLDRMLSALDQRVFLMHDVHETGGPVVFQSRWAMSYLAGPLTRDQIRRLDQASPEAGVAAAPAGAVGAPSPPADPASRPASSLPGARVSGPSGFPSPGVGAARRPTPAPFVAEGPAAGVAGLASPGAGAASRPTLAPPGGVPGATLGGGRGLATRPVLPPDVPQVFLATAAAIGETAAGAPGYRAWALGLGRVSFVDDRRGVSHLEEVALLADLGDGAPDWHAARQMAVEERDLQEQPSAGGGAFAAPPAAAVDPRSWRRWADSFADALYRDRRLELLRSPRTGLLAVPGESERDFRLRLADAQRAERDRATDEVRARFSKRLESKQEQVRRGEQTVVREQEQAEDAGRRAWLHAGSTLLGALLGRKALSATNVRLVGTSMAGFSRARDQAGDVERASETVKQRRAELAELQAQLEQELAAIGDRFAAPEELETVTIRPRRADVEVRRVALAWVPESSVAPQPT